MAKRKGGEKGSPVSGLTGGGPSIVGVSGGMRARDVSRIRPKDLARAEKTVVIRRREDPPRTP